MKIALLLLWTLLSGAASTPPAAVQFQMPYNYIEIAFHPSGEWLAAVSQDHVDVYRLDENGLTHETAYQPLLTAIPFSTDGGALHTPEIQLGSVQFSPDGERVLAGGMRGTEFMGVEAVLVQWQTSDGTPLETLETGADYNFGSPLSIDFGTEMTGYFYNLNNAGCSRTDNGLTLWDTATDKEQTFIDLPPVLNAVDLHEGRLAAIAADFDCSTNGVRLQMWDMETGEQTTAAIPYYMDLYTWTLALSDQYLVWGAFPNPAEAEFAIILSDPDTLEEQAVWTVDGLVTELAIAPDERVLAAVVGEALVLMELPTGEIIETITVPDWRPHSVVFSPDGTRLAAIIGGQMMIWELNELI